MYRKVDGKPTAIGLKKQLETCSLLFQMVIQTKIVEKLCVIKASKQKAFTKPREWARAHWACKTFEVM